MLELVVHETITNNHQLRTNTNNKPDQPAVWVVGRIGSIGHHAPTPQLVLPRGEGVVIGGLWRRGGRGFLGKGTLAFTLMEVSVHGLVIDRMENRSK